MADAPDHTTSNKQEHRSVGEGNPQPRHVMWFDNIPRRRVEAVTADAMKIVMAVSFCFQLAVGFVAYSAKSVSQRATHNGVTCAPQT